MGASGVLIRLLKQARNHEAVIFDLDGTLLDTLEDLADSMNSVLGRHGFPVHDVQAYKYFVGEGMELLVRRALPQDRCDQAMVARCHAEMREEYGRRWADKTRPYEGIPELLDGVRARGVSMAVLSNKPDDFTRLTVSRLLPGWRFERVLGLRPSSPRKPDPWGALLITREIGIPPEEFLYLGDTGTDMETARAAGMLPVGALWGFRTAGELLSNGAAKLISHPLELLELL